MGHFRFRVFFSLSRDSSQVQVDAQDKQDEDEAPMKSQHATTANWLDWEEKAATATVEVDDGVGGGVGGGVGVGVSVGVGVGFEVGVDADSQKLGKWEVGNFAVSQKEFQEIRTSLAKDWFHLNCYSWKSLRPSAKDTSITWVVVVVLFHSQLLVHFLI